MKSSATTHPSPNPLAILVNDPNSSGKSTLCRAIQRRKAIKWNSSIRPAMDALECSVEK